MTLCEKIMLALRWSDAEGELKELYEEQVNDSIEEAKAEMRNLDISEVALDIEDPEITRAVRYYCLSEHSEDPDDRSAYMEAFRSQVDRLRKSGEYVR